MPRTIARSEAVDRVTEQLSDGACLLCAMLRGDLGEPLWIARRAHASLLLPRYALRWGHALVALHDHCTRFADVDPAAWLEAAALAHRAARVAEEHLGAQRCYVASLGSQRDDIPMTSAHLHLHIVPLSEPDARPARVLTWEHGVVVAEEHEWRALRDELRRAFQD